MTRESASDRPDPSAPAGDLVLVADSGPWSCLLAVLGENQASIDRAASRRDALELLARLAVAAEAAEPGNAPTPLRLSPRLANSISAEVARQKSADASSSITLVVLCAVADAITGAAVPTLLENYVAERTRDLPVLGKVTVSPPPLGATLRAAFNPDKRTKAILVEFAAWYDVPLIVLLRLVLEHRYPRPRRRSPAPSGAPAPTTA